MTFRVYLVAQEANFFLEFLFNLVAAKSSSQIGKHKVIICVKELFIWVAKKHYSECFVCCRQNCRKDSLIKQLSLSGWKEKKKPIL